MTELKYPTTLLLTEELFVLLTDRQHGGFIEINDSDLRHAIAGAVLMDLANAHRIDTNLNELIIVDSTAIEDNILDYCLTILCGPSEILSVSGWIEHFSSIEISNYIRRQTVDRLIHRKILNRDPGGVLSIDQQVELTGHYPDIPLPEGLDVYLRAQNIVVTEDVPSPEEAMLIALIEACGISEAVFSKSITDARQERIQLIGRLDAIGRSVRKSISDTRKSTPENDVISRINRNISTAKQKRPPIIPHSLPLVGHSYFLRPIPTVPLVRYYHSLGPVFQIRDFGKKYTVLCGPEANSFCQKRSRSLFSSYYMYGSLAEGMDVQHILLSMDGEEHLKVRKGLSSGFSGERYMNQLPKIRDIILGEIPESGVVTTSHMFVHNTAKSIALTCNGYIPSTQQIDDLDYFFRHLVASSTLKYLPGFINRIRAGTRYKYAKAGFFSIFPSMFEEYLKDNGKDDKSDIMTALLEFHRKSPQLVPESELKLFSLGPIFAGMHTAASTATSALYLLLKHPDILERVQQESDYLFEGNGKGQPAPERLKKMDVTKRVVMESLRMYNPFSTVFRKVINTFDFGGYTIPAGTILLIPFGVPHYCQEFFSDPHKFDIDRFLPGRMEHRQPGVFMPYGFGTHRCLGSSISDAHLVFSIATILHYHDVKMIPANYKLKMILDGVPIASKKFKLKFESRKNFHSNSDLLTSDGHHSFSPPADCPVAHE